MISKRAEKIYIILSRCKGVRIGVETSENGFSLSCSTGRTNLYCDNIEQENLRFIKDEPLQAEDIQLWAPRYMEFFLLGIINTFCVIFSGIAKNTPRKNENPQQKFHTKP